MAATLQWYAARDGVLWCERDPEECALSALSSTAIVDDDRYTVLCGIGRTVDADVSTAELLRRLDRIGTRDHVYMVPAAGGILCWRRRDLCDGLTTATATMVDHAPPPALDVAFAAGVHNLDAAVLSADGRTALLATIDRVWLVESAAAAALMRRGMVLGVKNLPSAPPPASFLADPMLPPGLRAALAEQKKKRGGAPSPWRWFQPRRLAERLACETVP